MAASQQALKEILYQALGSQIGLVLTTSDPERARQALYAARREAADPDLGILQIRLVGVPDGGDLIIIKQKFAIPPPVGPDEVLA